MELEARKIHESAAIVLGGVVGTGGKLIVANAPDSAEEFVRAHWQRLYRVAFLVSADPVAAEDIAQEAMLKAVSARAAVDGRDPGPWLNRIAANAARDWLRSRARQEQALTREPPESEPRNHDSDSLIREITRAELAPRLQTALRRLAPVFRAVVVMRHLLDLTPAEISEILGVPAATVRTRDLRALRSLRDQLIAEEARDGG